MPTSEQLERETRASRERLSRTIDELKARLAPASIVDEATAYLRHATEEPLVAQAPVKTSRYALPLMLVGAGLAWLAVEARRAEKEREVREALQPPAEPVVAEEVALVVEPLPAAPEHGRSLAAVESISIAPGAPEEQKEGQRFP